ncbi:MAG: LLM class flavin-dependent oxidoreductase [Chloroflexi bacterium]|nr:LLM class flavin-dependent oxidoreductase [Chloroflexota bacterium]
MGNAGLKLSILDQCPANGPETATEAFQNTIELVRKAEAWGYHRFWVAEHHGSNRVMGSSPEVLISHLLAKTTHIRVGAGGVMLQHYSPYKVAENFNVLASLAPGRVDLGIGGGPGGLPQSTRALQQEMGPETTPLPEKLLELDRFLHNRLEESHPLYGLKASPTPPQPADLYLLGTTPSSAELAASLGMPYVFALFLNHDEAVMRQAIETYRSRFDATNGAGPHAMLALPVMAADTDGEAEGYASQITPVRITLESGRTFTVFSVEAAEEFGRQSQEKFTYEVQEGKVIHGSQETVRRKILDVQHRYQVDELFIVTAIRDFQKRLRSYELLSQVFTQSTVP